MNAINWIRTRQESAELSYWSSFVFFNPKDRSFNNRIYLVYLLVFFSIWWFIVMVWFSEAGAFLLRTISPNNPVSLAAALELSAILIWFLVSFFQSLRRCPIKFSEEDSYLVCQMPVNPRRLVLRWMVMPWIKSLIPFILFAIVLGFSIANSGPIRSGMTGQALSEYFRVSLRAVMVLIPIHLALFSINWAIGIGFMVNGRRKPAILAPLGILLVIALFFALGAASSIGVEFQGLFQLVSGTLSGMVAAGFGEGILGSRLAAAWPAAVLSIAALFLSARKFSPSRAAEETKSEVMIRNLRRYGFGDQAQAWKTEKRLGLNRRSAWLPDWQGAKALIWKDILQTRRRVSPSTFYILLAFFGTAIGLVFLPGLGGKMLLILTWTLQASKFLTDCFRQDLAHWTITRQLPIAGHRSITADLTLSGTLLLLVSSLGLVIGGLLSRQSPVNELVTLPGMIAAVAGVSVFVILKNARVDLLMTGQAPGVSEFGVIGGAVCAAIPVIIYSALPGFFGTISALAASLLVGYLAINAAANAYLSLE